MNTQHLNTILLVDQKPGEVYDAINNVGGWWSETIEGNTDKLNDEFIYRYKDMHYSKQKLVELIPAKKIVWLVMDSSLTFIKNQTEWNNTKVIFEISEKNGKTEIRFTHEGLTPESECFDACTKGWNYYLHESLVPLIVTGKGQPNMEEKPKSKTQAATA